MEYGTCAAFAANTFSFNVDCGYNANFIAGRIVVPNIVFHLAKHKSSIHF